MCTLMLSAIANLMNAQFSGQDTLVTGVKTDTRLLVPGDLFVALKGERVNGHHLMREAESKGAVGIVASETVETSLPLLKVANTLKALGIFAKAYRQSFPIPMVAVTGSCGKTTVKEMIASIFSLQGPTLATQGNLNTEVGVPLTLLRLEPEHQLAVIEMGARQKGDIAYLMQLVSPKVSLITNAGVAHIEIFKSERGIAEAKGEIFEGLDAGGTAVINADDQYADYWKSIARHHVITFGIDKPASISAKNIILEPMSSQFDLITDLGTLTIRCPMPGKHSIYNALAATAVSRALNISLETIQAGIERFKPVSGRLQTKTGRHGIHIIDDTYNANPTSVKAALSVLAGMQGQKIFVMGDMFELGPDAKVSHEEMGVEAKNLGIDKLFGVGDSTAFAVKGFGQGATHYTDKPSLIEALNPYLTHNTVILVKGSRGMRMEEIVSTLISETGN